MNFCKSSSCCSQKVSSVCASNACLVVGYVLGVVCLEVCLIASLFGLDLAENQSAVNVAPFIN
jgi:hypothetical protein